jgi:hypothetical protein
MANEQHGCKTLCLFRSKRGVLRHFRHSDFFAMRFFTFYDEAAALIKSSRQCVCAELCKLSDAMNSFSVDCQNFVPF